MSVSGQVTKSSPGAVSAWDYITRPNDTTQYAAGDGVSDAGTTATAAGYFTLNFGGTTGDYIVLTDFVLHKSDHDTTSADFALLLFRTVPAATGFDDNAASAITDTEMQDCVGVVPFPASGWSNVGTGDIQSVQQTIMVPNTSTSLTLYGVMTAQGGYTPAANEVFSLLAKAVK